MVKKIKKVKANMKNLTEQQAKNCEEAREPVCHCRCGGQFHGKGRGGADAPMSFYNELPEDDPHFAPSQEQLIARRKAKIEAKRQAKQVRVAHAQKRVDQLRRAQAEAQRDGQYERASRISKIFLRAYNYREAIEKEKI